MGDASGPDPALVDATTAALDGLTTVDAQVENSVPAEVHLTAEVKDAVIKQVEFYFSDSNLPTDEFLLKHVRKSPNGWVNLHLIAKFKRMRALSPDVPAIAAALRESEQLVVSADGNAVRRKAPLPELDAMEVAERTVIAEHLPRDKHSIEALTELFSKCGTVKMVRVCQPGEVKSTAQLETSAKGGKQLAHNQIVSNQVHALVEYSTAEEAAQACKELTEDSNWRAGLKVRPLVRGKNKWGHYHDHNDAAQEHHHKEPEHVSVPKDIPIKKVAAKHGSSTPDAAGSPVTSDAVAEALAMARKATAIAASSSRRRSLESNGGSASNSRRGSMDRASMDSVRAAKAALRPRRSSVDGLRRSSVDGLRRSSLEGSRHSLDHQEKKPSQGTASAAVFDSFASSAPRAEHHMEQYAKHIAKHLADDNNTSTTSGASTGENTSSGGEDGEERKSRRARRKDYAKWASGVAAATHKPGEKDSHGIYQPVMPDGSRGFSRGRGKPMPPPPQ